MIMFDTLNSSHSVMTTIACASAAASYAESQIVTSLSTENGQFFFILLKWKPWLYEYKISFKNL